MIDYQKIAAEADLKVVGGNYVGALQNAAVANGAPIPEYRFKMTGEPHAPTFSASLSFGNWTDITLAEGPNKKAAKQNAARKWVEKWNQK